jgi:hypothetical protein
MPALQLKPLDQDDIEALAIEREELWYVKLGNDTFGPYETMGLKEFASQNDGLFQIAEISHEKNSEQWTSFFETAPFNRKAPKLVSAKDLHADDRCWLLLNGQKHGPYKVSDLKNIIQSGKANYLDIISINEGMSWMKIFEHPSFADGHFTSNDLPKLPGESRFQVDSENALDKISDESTPLVDELATIAFIDTRSTKKENPNLKLEEILPLKKALEEKEFSFWKLAGSGLTASALIVGFVFVQHKNSSEETTHKVDGAVAETVQNYADPTVRNIPKFKRQRTPASNRSKVPSDMSHRYRQPEPHYQHDAIQPEPMPVADYQPEPPEAINEPQIDADGNPIGPDNSLVEREPAQDISVQEVPAQEEPVQEVGDF